MDGAVEDSGIVRAHAAHFVRHAVRTLALLAFALAGCGTSEVGAAVPADAADRLLVQAWTGFEHGDPRPARQALPQLRGSALEPWVAYWALQPTLTTMDASDYDDFVAAYPGSYVAERLGGEWLRELGRRGDWGHFARVAAGVDLGRDPQAQCYELEREYEVAGTDTSASLLPLWTAQKTGGKGCNAAARSLLAGGRIGQDALWARLRRFFDDGQAKVALGFAAELPPAAAAGLVQAANDPMRLLADAPGDDALQRQLGALALLSLARQDPQRAMALVEGAWSSALPADVRAEIGYAAARGAAQGLGADADVLYARAAAIDPGYQPDPVTTQWQVRAALRAADWAVVRDASGRLDGSDWAFWHASAQRALGDDASARAGYATLASPWTFYGQLATEALGGRIELPSAVPAPPSAQGMSAAAADPGLQRAFELYRLSRYTPGIWGEAVREWNHDLAGADDDGLHAAAQLACEREVWLLCINTSERVKGAVDWSQRYAMPYRGAIDAASARSGVSEAFLYGLIRQESRFSADIRSWAGADGLMQLMPATAQWVAHKSGMDDFAPAQVTQTDTNVALGSAYVAMLLQRFDGSEALAAAGYNAGPSRPARWRGMTLPAGDPLAAAMFAENIPVAETRDYVKQVLANATVYAVLLSGRSQSLRERLGAPGAVPPADVGDLP